MLIANYSEEVLNNIIRIHDDSFPFPNFSDPTFISKRIIVNNGDIIGCSLVKITSEAIVILDKTKPLRIRVDSLTKLQKQIVCELRQRGIRDIHAFINDSNVTRFAERLGWEKCPARDVLSLRFGY